MLQNVEHRDFIERNKELLYWTMLQNVHQHDVIER